MYTLHFDKFVEPARARPQIWRLILGSLLIVALYLLGVAVLFLLIWLVAGAENTRFWADSLIDADTPRGTLLLLSSFIAMALAPMVAARLIHKRKAGTLFGPGRVVVHDFVWTAGIVFVLYGVLTIVWSLRFDALPNLDFRIWLVFLPLAILGLLVQTAAEELIFRGYLMQQLAARFRSPLIWMVLPSLAFGAVHYDPETAGANVWLMVGAAAAFGFVASDLTRVTGSLGAAWGFHFANNTIAILFLAVQGTIPGLALFVTPYSAADTIHLPWLVASDLAIMLAAWWVARRTLQR